jgi:hypothetical protein
MSLTIINSSTTRLEQKSDGMLNGLTRVGLHKPGQRVLKTNSNENSHQHNLLNKFPYQKQLRNIAKIFQNTMDIGLDPQNDTSDI